MIDPYLPLVREILERYPELRASRLYDMMRARGYPGRPDHFRHLIALHRPRRPAEAYLRLRTLAAEQGQVDWGSFGTLRVGRADRRLSAFVLVLSYSRAIFLRFFLDQRMPSFLRGHVDAFTHFGGCPRILLYDNLKSAVLERDGEAIRFHPELLALATHYRFEARPVAPARGNEKGRVERAIQYIRHAFFVARPYRDLDDLNAQALAWCTGPAAERRSPEDPDRTVHELFLEERPLLLSLPDVPHPTDESVAVSVGKQPSSASTATTTPCPTPMCVARCGCWPRFPPSHLRRHRARRDAYVRIEGDSYRHKEAQEREAQRLAQLKSSLRRARST